MSFRQQEDRKDKTRVIERQKKKRAQMTYTTKK